MKRAVGLFKRGKEDPDKQAQGPSTAATSASATSNIGHPASSSGSGQETSNFIKVQNKIASAWKHGDGSLFSKKVAQPNMQPGIPFAPPAPAGPQPLPTPNQSPSGSIFAPNAAAYQAGAPIASAQSMPESFDSDPFGLKMTGFPQPYPTPAPSQPAPAPFHPQASPYQYPTAQTYLQATPPGSSDGSVYGPYASMFGSPFAAPQAGAGPTKSTAVQESPAGPSSSSIGGPSTLDESLARDEVLARKLDFDMNWSFGVAAAGSSSQTFECFGAGVPMSDEELAKILDCQYHMELEAEMADLEYAKKLQEEEELEYADHMDIDSPEYSRFALALSTAESKQPATGGDEECTLHTEEEVIPSDETALWQLGQAILRAKCGDVSCSRLLLRDAKAVAAFAEKLCKNPGSFRVRCNESSQCDGADRLDAIGSVSSFLQCIRCRGETCIGCGVTMAATKRQRQITFLGQTMGPNVCCANAQLLLLWAVLCGPKIKGKEDGPKPRGSAPEPPVTRSKNAEKHPAAPPAPPAPHSAPAAPASGPSPGPTAAPTGNPVPPSALFAPLVPLAGTLPHAQAGAASAKSSSGFFAQSNMSKMASDIFKASQSNAGTSLSPATGSSLARGVGYGGPDNHNYSGFRKARSKPAVRVSDPGPSKAVRDEDNTYEGYFRTAATLLSVARSEELWFGMHPPGALVSALARSPLLSKAADLLRNDSIEDIFQRRKAYDGMLQFIEALAGHPETVEVLRKARTVYPPASSLLAVSLATMAPAAEASSSTDKAKDKAKTMETGRALGKLLGKLGGQMKTILRYAKSHKNEFQSPDEKAALSMCEHVQAIVMKYEHTLALVLRQEAEQGPQPEEEQSTGEALTKAGPSATPSRASFAEWQRENAVLDMDDSKILENFYFEKTASSAVGAVTRKGRIKQLVTELSTMRSSLPEGIYVRHGASRPDIMKVLITGPKGTPYENGLFEFDVFCPATYPDVPPLVQFRTTGGGSVRFNPNLYEDGKGRYPPSATSPMESQEC